MRHSSYACLRNPLGSTTMPVDSGHHRGLRGVQLLDDVGASPRLSRTCCGRRAAGRRPPRGCVRRSPGRVSAFALTIRPVDDQSRISVGDVRSGAIRQLIGNRDWQRQSAHLPATRRAHGNRRVTGYGVGAGLEPEWGACAAASGNDQLGRGLRCHTGWEIEHLQHHLAAEVIQ